MRRGELFSLEAFLSLLIVLFFIYFSLFLYYNFPRDGLEFEDYGLSLSYAFLKLDETGFLNEIARNDDWEALYKLVRNLIPNCSVRLEVYDEELNVIYSKGHCDEIFKTIYYVLVPPHGSSTYYGIKVYIGD